MNKINKKKIIIILLTIFIIASIIFGVLISAENKPLINAQENVNTELLKLCEEMTQSSVFKVNNQRSDSTSYADYLVDRFQLNNKMYDVKDITDEWILQIVPVKLFKQKKEFFYMGNAYGFYFNYNSSTQTYIIYLICNELQYNDGLLTRTIKPIYYEKYVFNEETETVSLTYMDYYVYPNPQNPSVRNHYYHYQKYSDYDKLYLKDVNFTGSLYNENHLNIGENEYNPYQDNGGYFVESRYQFNGVSTQSGKTEFAGAILQIGLGYIPLGIGGLTVGDVLNVATAISELGKFTNNAVKDFRETITNEDPYKQEQFSGMTRNNQISNYGNPLKSSATKFHTTNTKEAVLLGINSGNYARNEYLINFYNQSNMWNTRYVGNVSLDIVKEVETVNGSRVEEIANDIQAVTAFSYTIDNDEKTQINENATTEIYILKDAKHKINFIAPVNGRFTISTIGDVANDIDINQNEILSKEAIGVNQKVLFYLKKNEIIELDIFKSIINSANILNVKVEFTPEEIIKDENKTMTIQPNEKEFYSFYSEEGTNAFDFNILSQFNISLEIHHTNLLNCKYDLTGLNLYGSMITKNEIYYIAVQNNNQEPITVNILLSDIISATPNQVLDISIMYNKIIKLTSPYSSPVAISVVSEAPIYMKLFDNNKNLINSTSISNKSMSHAFTSNQTYYLLVENYLYLNCDVKLTIDLDFYNLNFGNNNLNNISVSKMFVYKNTDINAEFDVSASFDFTIYDKDFILLANTSEGLYTFASNEEYYIIAQENQAIGNFAIALNFTEDKNGSYSSNGVRYIKYMPASTYGYSVSGVTNYTWYTQNLNKSSPYLFAGNTYYLRIEGAPLEIYNINISMNRNKLTLESTSNKQPGYYYIYIEEEGYYNFRTYCPYGVNSNISIYKEDSVYVGENDLACEDLVVDIESKLIHLTEGLYYIDLEANSASTRINLYIFKTN